MNKLLVYKLPTYRSTFYIAVYCNSLYAHLPACLDDLALQILLFKNRSHIGVDSLTFIS